MLACLDLDAFFVAVERAKNPALDGVPLIVGGEPSRRGVVCSASYEARERGINVIYGGHYLTETLGPKALMAHVAQRFGLRTVWLDLPTGL